MNTSRSTCEISNFLTLNVETYYSMSFTANINILIMHVSQNIILETALYNTNFKN